MTCDSYGAAEALQMGLVNRVVPGEQYWAEVTDMAEKIAGMSPCALSWVKRLVNMAEDTDLRSGCLAELGAAALSGV